MGEPAGRTEDRRSGFAAVMSMVGVTLFVVGMALARTREWSCNYRYWSDGGRNMKPNVALALTVVGLVLGVAAALIVALGPRSAPLRERRVVVVGGLVPIVAFAVFIFAEANGYGWTFDCSTG